MTGPTRGIPIPTRASKAVEMVVAGAVNPFQLFKYEHQPIRIVLVDSEPQFVARDVCNAIELTNLSMALSRLDDDEKGVNPIDTPGGTQQMATITESGLYSLVLRSDKKEAAKFRRWVTHKVLPEIRRTGSFHNLPAQPRQLPSKKELAQWVVEAEERADAAESQVAELEPSAIAWDRLHELGADFEVADAAKILSRDPAIEIGRNRLFEFMYEQDWTFRGRHNCWKAYQEQVDLGRLKHRPGAEYFHKRSGEYRTGDPTILITPKGLAELRRLLGASAQLTLVVVS
jgi:prophage antirepressor-like protein